MSFKKKSAKQIKALVKKTASQKAKQESQFEMQSMSKKEAKDVTKHIQEKLGLMGFKDQPVVTLTNKVEKRLQVRLVDKVDEKGEVVKDEKGETVQEAEVYDAPFQKITIKNTLKNLTRKIRGMARAEVSQFLHLDHEAYRQKLEKAKEDAMHKSETKNEKPLTTAVETCDSSPNTDGEAHPEPTKE